MASPSTLEAYSKHGIAAAKSSPRASGFTLIL
jgi:hypothetical protein